MRALPQWHLNPVAPRILAAGLAVCLLLLSGVFYAQSASHAAHHAHHKPATHATALCTWMCAAGQVLEGGPISLPSAGGAVSMLALLTPEEPFTIAPASAASRGPPLLSV
jgi:hypothetical protein